MAAVVLAFGAAVVWGAGDFMGGVASRRVPAIGVVLVSHFAGLALVVAVIPLLPEADLEPADVAWGAAAGLAGGVGVALLYRALADGAMSVVAPVTSLWAAALPVLVSVPLGERPSPIAVVGIGVALVAIRLITREPRGLEVAAQGARVRLLAMGAGASFGVFFLFLDQTSSESGLWPLVGARTASVALFAVAALVARTSLAGIRPEATTIVAAGVFDMAANVLFLLATQRGLVAVVAVVGSLYPASTVLLARLVLAERLRRPQVVGVGCALLAAGLIAAG
ncbi:MAG: EamA family transporter [Acidimicrobiales bacterium]